MILFTFVVGCDGDSIPTEKVQETYNISNDEDIEFLLSTGIPIEGSFSVHEQAKQFEISEIQHKDEGVFYIYSPKPGFTGTDMVKIKREDSNGAEVYSQTITTLRITVKE